MADGGTLWERSADPFSDDDVRRASEAAARLEAATGGQLADLGDAFLRTGSVEPGRIGVLLRLDGAILTLDIAVPSQVAQWGQPFAPARQLDDELVEVGTIPDSSRAYVLARSQQATRADAKARYHDFAWTRWRHAPSLVPAIDAYLQLAEEVTLEDFAATMDAAAGLGRAARIAVAYNHHRPEAAAAVRAFLPRVRIYSLLALELAQASAGLLTIDPPSAIESARALVAFALAGPDDEGRRQLLEAAERIARVNGDGVLANDAKRARAASLAGLAERTVGLQRLHWLREAIAIFQQLGDATALADLRRQYEQGGQEALGELQTLTGTVVLERDEIEGMVNRMKLADGPSLVGYLSLPFELGLWIDPDDLREERLREEGGRLTAMFPHTALSADGRIQPEPDREQDPEAFEQARDASYFGRRSGQHVAIFLMVLIDLRHRGLWSAWLLGTALAQVDEDLAQACFPGLVQFEAEDHWSAAHVLIPQIERALRVLGRRVGADQTRFTPAEGLRWATLDSILEDDSIREALGDPAATGINLVFSNQHGLNLRNNVAHGAFGTDDDAQIASLLALMTILTIARAAAMATMPITDQPPDQADLR